MTMDRYQHLKNLLKERKPVAIAHVGSSTTPFVVDAVCAADAVLFDKEHGVYGTEELIPLTLRCREKGLPSIVRVEDSQYHLIARTIDLGADGIMLPRTETLEQLKCAVDAIHFAPVGRTGIGGWGIFRDGETYDDFQKGRFLFPQIESPKGLANLPAMLDAYGEYIDGIIIGPSDYSIQFGVPCQVDHPDLVAQFQRVFDVCRERGMSCGCFAPDAEHLERYQKMGANIHWFGDELTYMRIGLQQYLDHIS